MFTHYTSFFFFFFFNAPPPTEIYTLSLHDALPISLVPALIMLFIRVKRFEFRPHWLCRVANAIFVGKIHKEMDHPVRSEEHTSELQSQSNLVCRLLLEKKKRYNNTPPQ